MDFDTAKNISILFRKMNTMTNMKLTPLELSTSKSMFLFCIYDHEQMTQTEICHELEMDKSTVAKMLMRLEKDGFVQKQINPDDTRSVLVSLTEKGVSVISKAKLTQDEWIREATDCLTDIEKRNFIELLEKVVSSLSSPRRS